MKREKSLGNDEGAETRRNIQMCMKFLDDPKAFMEAAPSPGAGYDDLVEECIKSSEF